MSSGRDLIGAADTVEMVALLCSKVSKARKSRRRSRKSKRPHRTCRSHNVSVQVHCRLDAFPTLQRSLESMSVTVKWREVLQKMFFCRLNQGGVSRPFPLPMNAQKSRHNWHSSDGCVQEDELMNPAFMTEAQVEEETQKVRQFGWGLRGWWSMWVDEDRAALL